MRWWLCSGGLLWAQVAVLPCAPTLIAVDEIGHVYAWCSAEKSLLKVWAPQYDSITRVGGGPGAREGFLDIRSLAPVGNQQLYVLDVGQQALLLLGTNLQVLQKVRFEEMAPELWQGFPSELTVMPGGDLLVALRETQEVIRIDAFGRMLVRFGGKVTGPAALVRIQALQAGNDLVIVLDEGYQLKVYDAWGTLLHSWPLPKETQFWAIGRGNILWQASGIWAYVPNVQHPEKRYFLSGLPEGIPGSGYLTEKQFYYTMGRALFVLDLP